jgi:hypothetical protein
MTFEDLNIQIQNLIVNCYNSDRLIEKHNMEVVESYITQTVFLIFINYQHIYLLIYLFK